MEELTVKLGLLMEAAQAQQALANSALERLREHSAGLDAVVREEIRVTLLEELQAVATEGQRAARSLVGLQRSVRARALLLGTATTVIAATIPLAAIWWFIPTRAELGALRATRDELKSNIAQLAAHGGRVQLHRCGAEQRLCVRVDRGAPRYGTSADYFIVQGY
jgi:hypothetical protein